MIGIIFKDNPKIIVGFIIVLFSYNFINFNLARPDYPGQASGANFAFSIERGYLLKDIEGRLNLLPCDSIKCANEHFIEIFH